MKSNGALQDKLAKQNEISRQKLARELVKLEKVEKSDLRMIETARHRFRSRHKKLEAQQQPSGSNAINVRMYETHNPGFCYHCTGAIKESGSPTKEKIQKDSYDFVRSILFTGSEVDPDKLLCLHLLTAHSTKWNNDDATAVRPVTPLMEKAKKKHYTGAWNNVLPCYVADVQQTSDGISWENMKLHEDPRNLSFEDQMIRDFEEKYKQYMENNADFGKVLQTNANQTRRAPNALGKMPIISPHVYSILGASHELRVKQAMVEGAARKKFGHSSLDLNSVDEKSMSFRLDDDDDLMSRVTTNLSTRNWANKSSRSPSRRSALGSSFKFEHGITMLKRKPVDHLGYRAKNFDGTPKDLVTIKPSLRTMKEASSKTSSSKSPFHNAFRSRPSTNSLLSGTLSPTSGVKKCRKPIYFNSPIKCMELRDKEYKTVPILVNYQIQALVHSVLEVLERVSPEKLAKIIETARDPERITKLLMRSEMQQFLQSLLGQSLVSSPESFVVSAATVANEIDFRFEGILEKEIIALTLEMPPFPSLDALIGEIRSNIFLETKKKSQSNENSRRKEGTAKKNETSRKTNVIERSAKKKPQDLSKLIIDKKQVFNQEGRCTLQTESAHSGNVCQINATCDPSCSSKTTKENKYQGSKKNETSSHEFIDTKEKTVGNNLIRQSSNTKPWKAVHDSGCAADVDRLILRRMTNPQRILVGQMCASLKTQRVNNAGLIDERVPLAALITPALSRESIKVLTRGTFYSKTEPANELPEDFEDNVVVPDKLTGPVLAKIRQDVAENETKRRLKSFLESKTE